MNNSGYHSLRIGQLALGAEQPRFMRILLGFQGLNYNENYFALE